MKKLLLLSSILFLSVLSLSSASASSLYSPSDITDDIKWAASNKASLYPYLRQDLTIYEKTDVKKIVNKYMDLYKSAFNSSKSSDGRLKDIDLVSTEFYKSISKYQKTENIDLYAWINVSCNDIYASYACLRKRDTTLSDLTPSTLELDLAYAEHQTLITPELKESILMKLNKIKSSQKEALLKQLVARIKTIATGTEDYNKRFLYLDLAGIIEGYINEKYPNNTTTEDLINSAIN